MMTLAVAMCAALGAVQLALAAASAGVAAAAAAPGSYCAACNYNGRCSADAKCACDAAWTGPHCASLALVPTGRNLGYQGLEGGGNVTSWGGSVVYAGGKSHMYAAEITGNCGMNVWLSNSQVIHAVSDDPLTQPFVKQSVVAGVFSHEPIAALAPTGETVVWYTASKCCVNGCKRCTGCHDGISPAWCGICDPPAPGAVANRNLSVNLPTYMVYSKSPDGPWSEPEEVPGTDVFADSNFAPVIKMDGSLVALTRGAIVHAADWRNVSTYVTVGKWHDEGEDPFLWEANGVLHNIVHVGRANTHGMHYYSTDGLNFIAAGTCKNKRSGACTEPAYNATISWSDGGSQHLACRERPHIVQNAKGEVIALTNGAGPLACNSPGKNDHSYTSLQAVVAQKHDDVYDAADDAFGMSSVMGTGGKNATTCKELQSCAYVKGRACQCNLGECRKYNDCCPDVQKVCAKASCKVYGCHKKSALCACTDSCSRDHTCCVDFYQTCGRGPSPPRPGPPGPPPPPVGPCSQCQPNGGPCGGVAKACPPQQFHLAPAEKPTVIVVSFVTGAAWKQAPNCTLSSAPGKRIGSFSGTTSTYSDGGWSGLLHRVRITGLAADGSTAYTYSCNGGPEFGFTSPPPPGAASFPMAVAAVADLGSRCSRKGGGCGNSTFDSLERAAKRGDFGLLLHAGDIAYTSGKQQIWDEYGRDIEGTAARVPYAVAPGNHEHYYNFSGYRHRFDMPSKNTSENLWWSWNHGGIHVLSFSTEHNYSVGSDQYAFIAQDLASVDRSVTPWLLVQGHKPLYCSTDDYYDCEVTGPIKELPVLEPLFLKHKVDLALFGHLHNFERSWPISGSGKVEQRSYTHAKSPVHVVIGGAGDNEGLTNRWENRSTEPFPRGNGWSAFHAGSVPSMGWARLTFQNSSWMRLEWVLSASADDKVLDSFVLTKDR